jgi:hypothetical protein
MSRQFRQSRQLIRGIGAIAANVEIQVNADAHLRIIIPFEVCVFIVNSANSPR